MTDSRSNQWLRRTFQQAPWRSQTQATSLVLAVVVMVVVIGALYLAQASRTATAGRRLQALETQRKAVEQQNAQLRAEIAALRSVPRLTSEAERLGYHPASMSEVEYLRIEGAPPQAEPTPAPPLTIEQVVPRYNETLEGWLAEQFAVFRVRFGTFWQRTFGSGQPDEMLATETPDAAPQETPNE
jgi:cell division protein FtsL